MASETTRMFRAVVVAGVSLTACSGAPVVEVPTPAATPVSPVNDGKSTGAAGSGAPEQRAATPVIPVNDARSTGDVAATTEVKAVPVEAGPVGVMNDGKSTGEVVAPTDVKAAPVGAGDPLAATAEDTKVEPKLAKKSARKSAAERKREAEERKRREWEAKFPHIL